MYLDIPYNSYLQIDFSIKFCSTTTIDLSLEIYFRNPNTRIFKQNIEFDANLYSFKFE